MPEKVTQIDASQDPATTKQYDSESSVETKFKDFYELVDKLNIAMMGTYRNGVGVCCPPSRHIRVLLTLRPACHPLHGRSKAIRPRFPLPL